LEIENQTRKDASGRIRNLERREIEKAGKKQREEKEGNGSGGKEDLAAYVPE